MKNRLPTKPGRALITPEDGSPPFYATVTRADEPTEEGTPLNKATLLTDETAALYGLGEDSTVNDVLAEIDDKHIWRPKSKSTATPSGSIPYLSSDRKSLVDYGVSGNYLPTVLEEGVTLSFLPSINLPSQLSATINAAAGAGKFIVAGYYSGARSYYTTTGGASWTSGTINITSAVAPGVAYDEKLGLFVAVTRVSVASQGYNSAAYSANGRTWTSTTLPAIRSWNAVAGGNGIFVAGALNGYAAYSTNGIDWTDAGRPTTLAFYDIKFDAENELFIAALGTENAGIYSRDGKTWASVSGTVKIDVMQVAVGNGKHVLFDKNSRTVYVRDCSKIGTSDAWTAVSLPVLSASNVYTDVSFANGMFFASSDEDSTQMAVSTNGTSWTLLSDEVNARYGIYHDGERFIGVVGGANIIDSYDGKNWLVRNTYRLRTPDGKDVTNNVKTALGIS